MDGAPGRTSAKLKDPTGRSPPPPTKWFALARPGARAELVGVVRDVSTNEPFVDTVVTLQSPALNGEQTVVTDAKGAFHVKGLPPGEYGIIFESERHRPTQRRGLTFRPGAKPRVDARLPYYE